MDVRNFSVLTFDCYGTLIDWEQGIWDALQPLLLRNATSAILRHEALQAFGEIESDLEQSSPGALYDDLLVQVHAALAARFNLDTEPDLDRGFGASLPHWPAFPDSADALRQLGKSYKLVILSNVSRNGFAASNRKLGVSFDAIYTAEDVGSYKPSLRNFEYMLERLQVEHGVSPKEILHTAQSPFHDLVPAKQLGLACAWIDRQNVSRGGSWGATSRTAEMPAADFVFPSLAAMASAARPVDRHSAT